MSNTRRPLFLHILYLCKVFNGALLIYIYIYMRVCFFASLTPKSQETLGFKPKHITMKRSCRLEGKPRISETHMFHWIRGFPRICKKEPRIAQPTSLGLHQRVFPKSGSSQSPGGRWLGTSFDSTFCCPSYPRLTTPVDLVQSLKMCCIMCCIMCCVMCKKLSLIHISEPTRPY